VFIVAVTRRVVTARRKTLRCDGTDASRDEMAGAAAPHDMRSDKS
jgi:hypothetical protein